MSDKNTVIVVGGPAGTGKSTIGERIAKNLGCPFVEGDALHPQANIDKMSHGIPLTDDDRWDWLAQVSQVAYNKSQEPDNTSRTAVVTCSMLKKVYREHIKASANAQFKFVFLTSPYEVIEERVAKRGGHFMKSDMVKSQFDIMEVPQGEELAANGGDAWIVDVSNKSVDQVVEETTTFGWNI